MKNQESLARKMHGLNTFNLWNMIVSIIVEVIGLIVAVPAFLSLLAIASEGQNIDQLTNDQATQILITLGSIFAIAGIFAIVALVMHIIAAVKNNGYEIKQVYNQTGVGQTPGILSILSIFFFGWIFAIIVYVQTHKVLNSDPSKLKINERN